MNRFRRITLAGLIGGIAAGFSWKAFGQGRHGFHGGANLDERIDKMVKHLAIEIDATPEQQQKLAAIAKAAAKDLAPLRGQAMETRKQAMELLSAPSVDRAGLEKLRVSKLQHADAASRRITQALGDAAEVLTPEQRVKLAEHVARMGHRRHRHRG
ncbi:MAG: Spy/CpxP family protein refolding chaperone [Betaproteobacteria bacterium]